MRVLIEFFLFNGCGGLLRDHHGAWIIDISSFEGIGDVYLAELLAIIHGFSLTWRVGAKVVCEMDCSDMVNCFTSQVSLNLHSCAAYIYSRSAGANPTTVRDYIPTCPRGTKQACRCTCYDTVIW